MFTSKSLALASLGGVACLIAARASVNTALPKSAFPPDALQRVVNGRQGAYDFLCYSDVEEKPGKKLKDHIRLVYNRHGKNYLPVEWAAAGLEFDEIPPGGVGKNQFNSSMSYAEKPDTPVKYGPRLQYEGKAPVHSFVRNNGADPSDETFPPLDSTIEATLAKAGGRFPVAFTITSTVERDGKNTTFNYLLINMSPSEIALRTPGLSRLVFRAKVRPEVMAGWARDDSEKEDLFRFKRGAKDTLRLRFEGKLAVAERRIRATVTPPSYEKFERDAMPRASGIINIYIPDFE